MSSRTFTLDEAQKLLPVLESLLKQAIHSKTLIEEVDAEMQETAHRIFMNGGTLVNVIHLAKRKRHPQNFDVKELVDASKDFSGAEIEEAIISALYDAFYAKEELATGHVLTALGQTVPLAKTMAEKITAQRNWAAGRARNANVIRAVKSDGDAQPIA